MKIKIVEDELYPYYLECKRVKHDRQLYGTEVELSEAFIARWKLARTEFHAVQDIIEKVLDKACEEKEGSDNG
jgi:hypothetical protein